MAISGVKLKRLCELIFIENHTDRVRLNSRGKF